MSGSRLGRGTGTLADGDEGESRQRADAGDPERAASPAEQAGGSETHPAEHPGDSEPPGDEDAGGEAAPFAGPPAEARVARFEVNGEELAVLSFPLSTPSKRPPTSLSAAEQEVVAGILGGQSNSEIARARRTSVRTVANQVASIFRKMEVSSRAELVARFSAPSESSR